MYLTIVFDFSRDDRWKQWLCKFFWVEEAGGGEGGKQGAVWSI